MRPSLALSLRLFALVASATCGLAPAMAGEMATGRIQIEYVPPQNPKHQAIYALLKERRVLEKVQETFGAFELPRDVTVRTTGCDGVSNCWFQEIDGRPTVTLCYEYLQEVWDTLPKQVSAEGITPTDALAGQFFFAVAHEFGHLSFSVYHVPLFGHEENAADNFAAFIMLQFHEEALRLIGGAAWSYQAFIKYDKDHPSAKIPLAAFSSNHGQPEERYYSLLCIAYGSDEKRYALLVDKGYLTKTRARDCKYEFDGLHYGFHDQIVPHIDKKLVSKAMETDWLTLAPPQSKQGLR